MSFQRFFTCFLILFVWLQISTKVFAKERKTLDDLLNTCIDSKEHRSKPGKEGTLFQQCSPWKDRSCCTYENTVTMHNKSIPWLNFNWDHSKKLSPECRKHFQQDLCFYECSPNTGPWLQEVKMKIRNEKYFHVPLCKSECDNWWKACQNDFTCSDNWSKGFNWTSGINTCPENSVDKSFKETFKTAKKFCEQVWDYSWKVVPDSEPCMKIWFTGPNPNDKIAKQKAEALISSSSTLINSKFLYLIIVFVFLI